MKKLYLYTNNHFSAKSVANAAMIKQQLGEPIEGEYPPEFVARYPELAGVVDVSAPTAIRTKPVHVQQGLSLPGASGPCSQPSMPCGSHGPGPA